MWACAPPIEVYILVRVQVDELLSGQHALVSFDLSEAAYNSVLRGWRLPELLYYLRRLQTRPLFANPAALLGALRQMCSDARADCVELQVFLKSPACVALVRHEDEPGDEWDSDGDCANNDDLEAVHRPHTTAAHQITVRGPPVVVTHTGVNRLYFDTGAGPDALALVQGLGQQGYRFRTFVELVQAVHVRFQESRARLTHVRGHSRCNIKNSLVL